jgi:hypothetical protein
MDTPITKACALANVISIDKEVVKKKKRDYRLQPCVNHWTQARLEDFAQDHGIGNNTAAGVVLNLFFKKLEAGKILP